MMSSRILPVIALMLSIGIFFAYVDPLWTGKVAETKVAIAADESALQAAQDYKARENELAAQRDAIDPANLARVQSFLPDSVNNVNLILNVNALAARSGLALSNIDVAKSDSGAAVTQSSGPIGTVDLSLSAVGTYSALKNFLQGVEKSARLLDIREIQVRGSDSGVYDYQMTIRLYWLR